RRWHWRCGWPWGRSRSRRRISIDLHGDRVSRSEPKDEKPRKKAKGCKLQGGLPGDRRISCFHRLGDSWWVLGNIGWTCTLYFGIQTLVVGVVNKKFEQLVSPSKRRRRRFIRQLRDRCGPKELKNVWASVIICWSNLELIEFLYCIDCLAFGRND